MLPKQNRLKREEIDGLKNRKTNLIQGKFFGLLFEKKKGLSKFGVIVSANISKKASDRNKIKRMFYSAIGREEKWQEQGSFLFLAKKNCLNAEKREIEQEIVFLANKLSKI